jgi:hypothetical protein
MGRAAVKLCRVTAYSEGVEHVTAYSEGVEHVTSYNGEVVQTTWYSAELEPHEGDLASIGRPRRQESGERSTRR